MDSLRYDPNRAGDELRIDLEDLPWSQQDFAFDLISTTFGLSEDMIEALPPSERTYWAALTEATASCVLMDNGINGEVETITPAELIELHSAANSSEATTATTFLQQFAHYSLVNRADLMVTGFTPSTVSASHYFARALATFSPSV